MIGVSLLADIIVSTNFQAVQKSRLGSCVQLLQQSNEITYSGEVIEMNVLERGRVSNTGGFPDFPPPSGSVDCSWNHMSDGGLPVFCILSS